MENQNNIYTNLVEATNSLAAKGFSDNFNINEPGDLCMQNGECVGISAENITIVEYHRFEGQSDSSDNSVIYAIETKNGHKGIIIDAYGTYASQKIADLLKQMNLK